MSNETSKKERNLLDNNIDQFNLGSLCEIENFSIIKGGKTIESNLPRYGFEEIRIGFNSNEEDKKLIIKIIGQHLDKKYYNSMHMGEINKEIKTSIITLDNFKLIKLFYDKKTKSKKYFGEAIVDQFLLDKIMIQNSLYRYLPTVLKTASKKISDSNVELTDLNIKDKLNRIILERKKFYIKFFYECANRLIELNPWKEITETYELFSLTKELYENERKIKHFMNEYNAIKNDSNATQEQIIKCEAIQKIIASRRPEKSIIQLFSQWQEKYQNPKHINPEHINSKEINSKHVFFNDFLKQVKKMGYDSK